MSIPNWLRYSNQGATRSQPLMPSLVDAMSFLGPMGITMDVYSGGQDESGPNRTGSHRHDRGGAGDVRFFKDGRQLDWSNPADVPIYQDIVRQAKAGGVTGFGAGPGYMGQGTMHLGFGTPAVWGAGGKSANAPDWLRAAYGDSGTVQQVKQVAQATGMSEDAIKSAFLSSIAGTEAPAYNTLYGGGNFGEDYSQHPNRRIPIMSGPNKGDYSTAAGRYQFLNSTWQEAQNALGLKDFSPQSQDAAAWWLANRDYKKATGGDLMAALQSGDPEQINAAAKALSGTWTSLPSGIEQSGKYKGGTFADAYQNALGSSGGGSTNPFAGSTATAQAGANSPYALAAASKNKPQKTTKQKVGGALAGAFDALGGAMGGGGGQAQMIQDPEPEAAIADAQVAPIWGGAASDDYRERLARMMAQMQGGGGYA